MKDRFAVQFQENGTSGDETNQANSAQRKADELSEMGEGPHFESGIISNEELPQKSQL